MKPLPLGETAAEKYARKQRERAAAARESARRDAEREALREKPRPVVVPESRIVAKIEERRYWPDTPETENEARRLNMGRMFNEFQQRETAVTRAIYKSMLKGKIAGEREMKMPGEEEVSPAAREARLKAVERITIEGTEYVMPRPDGGRPGL